jgi:hypothetical protein
LKKNGHMIHIFGNSVPTDCELGKTYPTLLTEKGHNVSVYARPSAFIGYLEGHLDSILKKDTSNDAFILNVGSCDLIQRNPKNWVEPVREMLSELQHLEPKVDCSYIHHVWTIFVKMNQMTENTVYYQSDEFNRRTRSFCARVTNKLIMVGVPMLHNDWRYSIFSLADSILFNIALDLSVPFIPAHDQRHIHKDGMHFNASGHEYVANEIEKCINERK